MACPFFLPTEKVEGGTWLHSSRLPLGAGWTGQCSAPGHEGATPTDAELRDFCNMGYAAGCTRLPQERPCDAVRFSVARDNGSELFLWFVCETGHRPTQHGTLQYDVSLDQWISSHPEPRIQKMAQCYLQSYMFRRIRPALAGFPSSTNP